MSAGWRRRAARWWGWGLGLAAVGALGCDASSESPGVGMLRSGLEGAQGGAVIELDLSRGLSEQAQKLSLFSSGQPPFAELVQAFARSRLDRRTRGYLVRLGEADLSWAQAEELGRLFSALEPDKPVVCHAHGYSNATLLFVARACDRIWLSPAGEVASVGIGGQMLYLKRLLDRFKVHADFLHMGRYKSAAESITQDGPSPEARESLLSVLGSIRTTWLEGVSAARPRERITHALEHGPYAPQAALDRGLIDAIGYLSDAREDAKQRAQVEKVESSFGLDARREAGEELAELIRFITGSSSDSVSGARVVVLTTSGGISMRSDSPFGGGGDGIAAEPLSKTLRRLREDDDVKAVVLRIDSPGGSALASDLIWHDLMELREKKPLVASLAEMAASGGYYMACAATRILAERTTIVGSIGVVGGKIVIGDALGELGVTGVTFTASDEPGAAARAGYLSPLTPWDDATRESVRAQMQAIYDLFLARVSQGRALPIEHVRSVAEGRIWSGVQGLEHKLIDEYGGLSEAIAVAKREAKLPDDAPVKIEGSAESLLEMLNIDSDSPPDEGAIRAALARLRAAGPTPLDGVAEPLRSHIMALAPLIGRERVLTVAPFAWTVE